jgi:phage terminase large subunit
MDDEYRYRYYVAYGGRGGAKSWGFARALLLQALKEPLRILCTREIQRTIAESVHHLLKDQIAELGLEDEYLVLENSISGRNGATFLFAGLRQQDVHKIKSYEGVDIVWVEEAQVVTKRSWQILIPTIRAEGSEIWVTFNPEMDTDDTYTRFVVRPPPNSWVQEINWRDNPWFKDTPMEQERLFSKESEPEEYEHIWEGAPRTLVPGAIYAREMARMVKDRRIRPVPYDPSLLVHTIWDLGWNDQTSIIFAQRVASEVRIIDYEEESFLRLDEWARRILDRDYAYGDHWLPHDGKNKLQASGGKSIQQQLKVLLRKEPKIVPKPENVEIPIKSARNMFPRVYIDDGENCERLVTCLKRFRRAVPETTGEPGLPVKDEYRHGADAWGGLARIVHKLHNDLQQRPMKVHEYQPAVPGVM